jgi:HSP20 family protein
MSRVDWQPLGQIWDEFERSQNEADRFLRHIDTRGAAGPFGVHAAYPAVNVWDDEQNIYLESELPGFTLKNLEITVTGGNQVTLKGRRESPETGKTTWHRQERSFGLFSRTLTLPVLVDSDRVEAHFQLGALCVKLPKSPKSEPRRIEIKRSRSDKQNQKKGKHHANGNQ